MDLRRFDPLASFVRHGLSRRTALAGVGAGGVAAVLAALGRGPGRAAAQEATPAGQAAEKTNFRWMSVSRNTADGATDQFIMNGNGFVSGDELVAVGSFIHVDTAEPPGAETPKTLLGFGTWRAERLVSLELIGTYGAFASGTLVMEVTLYPEGERETPAEVTMNCNVPPAGLFTGLAEGFSLTVGDMSFEPWVLPVAPDSGPPEVAVGATVFTILDEDRP